MNPNRKTRSKSKAKPRPANASTPNLQIADVLEKISDAVVALDPNWCYTYVNEKAAQLFSRKREELIGKHIWTEFPEGIGQPFYHSYYRAVETQQPISLEEYYPPYDRWFENRIYPSKDGLTIFFTDITDRKQAEAQLKRASDFSNALLDSLPGVFYFYDENLKFLRWNKNFEKVTGYSSEEIARMSPLDFFAGEEKRLLSERIHDVFATGISEAEANFVSKDGRRTPYYFTGIRTQIDDKACLLGVGIDVTQRHQVEDALRANEERYRLISNVVSDYVFSTQVEEDGHLRLNWVAGAFEAITGYTFEEYRARGGWRAALHPDDMDVDVYDLEKIRQNLDVVSTVRTLKKDGSVVWVQVYAHPVWDVETQRLTGIYGAVQDITARKRAEEIMAASKKQLSLIFDTVSDVIYLLAIEPEDSYRFVSVNPAFLAVTGLTSSQVVGKRMEEVLPETAHALVRSKYQQAIQERKTIRWEEVSAYPTGTLYGEVAVTPAWDATGVCTHLIGSVHDITEIRQAQEEITKLNQALEQRVAERTTQLQTANKDLESFSYSVSHDLRAPLRAISGFAQIIARRHRASLNEEGQHYFDNIVQASERMGYLIDDLLQYSRLGRQSVRLVPVPLKDVLAPLAKELAPRLKEIGGTLEIAADLPTVIADKTLLRQIFTNLLDNALTYRRREVAAQVTVTWRADGKVAIMCVRDNGIGIPAEHHQRIFNIFQRLHSDDEYPGTGIGLATVKKSVEMLGAKVWVESEAGQGSAFFIQLSLE